MSQFMRLTTSLKMSEVFLRETILKWDGKQQNFGQSANDLWLCDRLLDNSPKHRLAKNISIVASSIAADNRSRCEVVS